MAIAEMAILYSYIAQIVALIVILITVYILYMFNSHLEGKHKVNGWGLSNYWAYIF